METEFRCSDHWGEGYTSYLILFVSLITCLTTLPSNLLVCVTVVKDPHKTLHFPFMILVVNAIIAGLISGSVTEPLSFALTLIQDSFSTTAVTIAQIRNVTFFITSTVGLMTSICLCVDRYLAISAPAWYKGNVSYGRLALASGFIWTVGIGLPMTCLPVGFQKYAFISSNMTLMAVFAFVIFSLFTFKWDWDEAEVHDNTDPNHRDPSPRVLNRVFYCIICLYLICHVPASIIMHIAFLAETMSCGRVQYLEEIHFMLILIYSAVLPYLCIACLPQSKRGMLRIIKCPFSSRIGPQQPANMEEWNMTSK